MLFYVLLFVHDPLYFIMISYFVGIVDFDSEVKLLLVYSMEGIIYFFLLVFGLFLLGGEPLRVMALCDLWV